MATKAAEITSLMSRIDAMVLDELRASIQDMEAAIERLNAIERTGSLSQLQKSSVGEALVGLRRSLNQTRIARDEREDSLKERDERNPPKLIEAPKSETVVALPSKKSAASA